MMRQEAGDICHECGEGVMGVQSCRLTKDRKNRKQYLKCSECRSRGQCVFPVDELGRRQYGTDSAELRAIINRQSEQIERLATKLQEMQAKYYL
jgi:hypothetical protein